MMWVFFVLVLLIPLAAVILDSQLGRALARRIEGGGGGPEGARLAALEAEVDRLGRELERLQEQAEFVDRLLAERRHEPLAEPKQERLPEGAEERLPDGDGG